MVFFRALSLISGHAKHIKDHREIEHQREYFAKLSNSISSSKFANLEQVRPIFRMEMGFG